MVQLSAEGVTIHGNRFHDQAKTTALMNKMARYGKERRQRRNVTSSRTVWVRATWDPGDVTRVHIWDPIDRTSITLPNWDRRFSEGLSWFAAAKIREWSAERNQAFHSDAERAAARVAHRKYLMSIMPGAKSPQRHQAARILEPRTELMPGDRVEIVSVPSRSEHEIPHDTGIMRANRAMTVPKGRPFGGKAGARKAAATRARKKSKSGNSRQEVQTAPPREPTPNVSSKVPISVADAIRARVAARLSKKG
jgi:putative transposase